MLHAAATNRTASVLTEPKESAYNSPSMKVLGVTGTIGSGKSTVCRLLEQMGCPVVDADREAHLTYRRGTRTWQKLVDAFGEGVLDSNGQIDRAVLARIVFNDSEALERLNSIVHPATRRRVSRKLRRLSTEGHAWTAIEATLLIEAGWRDMVDRLWVVAAPDDVVIARLSRDRGQDEQSVRTRLARQTPAERMMEYADDIIYNDGHAQELEERVRALWRDLTSPSET